MKRLPAACAAAVMITSSVLVAVLPASPAQAEPIICNPSESAALLDGEYIVRNDIPGATTAQCLDVGPFNFFEITQADHDNPTTGPAAGHPVMYKGCQGGVCTLDSSLPLSISDAGVAQGSLSNDDSLSGEWNVSLDLWLDPTPRTTGQNAAQVRIWVNHAGSVQPPGTQVGTFSTPAHTTEVWYGNVGWDVITYVLTPPGLSSARSFFDLRTYLLDVVGRGYVADSWYVTSVQAGAELWTGGAGLHLNFSAGFISGPVPPQPPPPPAFPPPPPPPPSDDCTATPEVDAQWGRGYVMHVAVSNDGESTSGWDVGFTLPSGHEVDAAWNAELDGTSGTVTATDRGYNGDLSESGVTFGLLVSRPDGAAGPPTSFSCALS